MVSSEKTNSKMFIFKFRIIRKKQILKQRLRLLEKMIKNSRCEQVRLVMTLLLAFLSLGAVLSPNRQVQKTGMAIAGTTFALSGIAGVALACHYRKLRKQDAYWEKQEQALERS